MANAHTKNLVHGTAVVAVLLAAGLAAPSPAAAAPERVETPVTSSSPITGVAESVVRVKIPLPASAGPHPEACNWLSYLRFRDRNGPANPADADRILIAQPGVIEGAGAFDSVARNTITQAAGRGAHLEFWALDRRSNCLEDPTGVLAGAAAKDPHLTIDYYHRNKPIGGKTFAGFQDDSRLGWLDHVGLEQTVRDQRDLMLAELPDQRVRKSKVLCGGHSLGGALTAYFAIWDFDGDHATTADAGYNQCAGYFALDSKISTSLNDIGSGDQTMGLVDPGIGYGATQLGLASGLIPRTLSLPALINPEMMNALATAGVAALSAPGGRSDLVDYLPSNLNLDTTTRLLFSKNLLTFIAGSPSVKDFELTNEAALGGLLDDHSQPLAFLQASVGFFDGGRIADKEFPVPGDLARIPGLDGLAGMFGKEPLAIPDQPNGPLYTWRNYDRVGAPDDPMYRTKNGTPFTSAGKEVSDIQELARSLAEHPLDFTEEYFPTKLITDLSQAGTPEIGKDAVHEEGLTVNPILSLLAGDGLSGGGSDRPGRTVVAPGYQHLDVLTAAPTQNNGIPEVVSAELSRFLSP
jgi:hypothetical protein